MHDTSIFYTHTYITRIHTHNIHILFFIRIFNIWLVPVRAYILIMAYIIFQPRAYATTAAKRSGKYCHCIHLYIRTQKNIRAVQDDDDAKDMRTALDSMQRMLESRILLLPRSFYWIWIGKSTIIGGDAYLLAAAGWQKKIYARDREKKNFKS